MMPENETYLEIGTMEGRTINAAAVGNENKRLITIDPCEKYGEKPQIPFEVNFHNSRWEETFLPDNIGLIFYDGDHSMRATANFMIDIKPTLADQAVLILDDWDRESVREGAFVDPHWQLLREMPEYTDGLTCPPNHFGYYFGVALFGYRRSA